MADQMSAPKRKSEPANMLAGYASDAINALSDWGRKRWAFGPESWDQKLNLLGVPGLARTLDRISYGEPLTTGKGMTTQMRPDTVDALGFVPLSPKTAAAVLSGGLGGDAMRAATVWHGNPAQADIDKQHPGDLTSLRKRGLIAMGLTGHTITAAGRIALGE